ncbi:hypothetical protein AYI69_g6569 [Smittium culicis]|uniref:Uncharacterized protein n=1 Tax=Smittium culicis TaxID=133412 RepID=A0A1R1XY74_9FUNG|nr:hypothetical protein AYI69_g6569 [Smittium culicis]
MERNGGDNDESFRRSLGKQFKERARGMYRVIAGGREQQDDISGGCGQRAGRDNDPFSGQDIAEQGRVPHVAVHIPTRVCQFAQVLQYRRSSGQGAVHVEDSGWGERACIRSDMRRRARVFGRVGERSVEADFRKAGEKGREAATEREWAIHVWAQQPKHR